MPHIENPSLCEPPQQKSKYTHKSARELPRGSGNLSAMRHTRSTNPGVRKVEREVMWAGTDKCKKASFLSDTAEREHT